MEQGLKTEQPEYVHLENKDEGLTIFWRWSGLFGRKLFSLTLFAILCNMCVLSLVVVIVAGMPEFGLETVLNLLLFPPIWFAVFLIYYVLSGYMNQTTVTVNRQEIQVTHSPLPWVGSKRLPVRNVRQLYVVQRFPTKKVWGGQYSICAIMSNGTHQPMLRGLDSGEHALFVEREIEKHLGIKNWLVKGSYTPQ
jgi:hypothetical protein